MRRILFFVLCAGASAQSLSLFVARGLDFMGRNSPTSQKYLPETMGGGVALIDYDQDGRLDVFLVNGGHFDDPVRGVPNFRRDEPVFWNRLYRQSADGSFTDVTLSAGLSKAGNVYGMGAAVGDYDNDGFPDLYVTNFGGNALYRNDGKGAFVDVTAQAGVAGSGWTVSAAFLDYDGDGLLDLFAARYLDWDPRRNILCGTPFHAYCRPDKYDGTTNLLFRNEGNGRFRDVSRETGIGGVKGKGMGVAVNDYDGDGRTDIFVSNDGMEQFLFHNQGGRFREVALEAGVALSDNGKPFAGMGASFEDYDNDGRPDIVVTNLALEKYALYRNDGGGHFTYASLTSGLAALTSRSSGWGIGFGDFDNDGWKDIFAAQSHVLDNVEKIHSGLRYLEPPALYRNAGGRFERGEVKGATPAAGRGVAFGDLDNDGALDAVMAVLGGRPLVFRSQPARRGVTLKLVGRKSNRDGIGATVRSGNQWVHVTTAGSYLSASDSRVHLAAGSPVEIRWPSGKRQTVAALAPGGVVTVKEEE